MSVASPQAVAAYKQYLYHKGNKTVAQIENVKAGTPIDLKELDTEIAAVEKTIAMCESLTLPTLEEVYKLKGLKSLRDQLIGRTWPSFSQLEEQIVKQAKAKAALQEKAKQEALMLAQLELQAQKQQNYNQQVLKAALEQDDPKPWKKGTSLGVQKFKNPILVPKAAPFGLGKVTQQWVMRVGMLSNCNVMSLQRPGWPREMLLRCEVCAAEETVQAELVVSTNVVVDQVEVFCKAHRHDPVEVAAPVGRLFRED